jgi:hypothetical protein
MNSWLNPQILSVNSFSITNIVIAAYDEKPVVLYGTEKDPLTMDKVSKKEMVDESKARSVRYTLSYLRFDDIADPELPEDTLGFDKPATFSAVTTKGERYVVLLGGTQKESANRYVRVSAEMLWGPPVATIDGKDKPARKDYDDARKRVDDANRRVSGWTYALAPEKFATMLYTRKDLVKKKDD